MPSLAKTFIAALGFLSLIPVGRNRMLEPDDFGRFPGVFPLVGLALGLILAAFQWLAGLALPPAVAVILTLTLLVVLTRGFHLDGLADAADGLLSHKSLERKLEIMKDSRQGTFGVLAIVLDVMLKAALLAHLAGRPGFLAVVLLWPMWGRLAASATAVASRYARPEGGLGRYIVENSKAADLVPAAAVGLLAGLLGGLPALFTSLFALAFGAILVPVWRRAIGGLTGDLLGATVELGEIAALLFYAVII